MRFPALLTPYRNYWLATSIPGGYAKRDTNLEILRQDPIAMKTFLPPFALIAALLFLPLGHLRGADGTDSKNPKPIPAKLVVLTFDDAPVSHAVYVGPLLKKYGFGATFYVCEFPGFENKKHYMTWEQIRELHDMGFEIGNHTLNHRHIPPITVEEAAQEVEGLEKRCQEYGIPKPTSFCWPAYGIKPALYPYLAEKGYLTARGGGERPYDPTKDNIFNTPSYTIKNSTIGDHVFENALKQAVPGQAVIFTFHGVPDLAHDWVSTEIPHFERFMKHLKDNDYQVISMGELAEYIDTKQAIEKSLPMK